MIRVITNAKQIQKLQLQFQQKLDQYFTASIDCRVGYPGGSFRDTVRYSPDLDIWMYVRQLPTRFWNGFGIGRPAEGVSNSLAGEINFPYEGINRRIAGVFAIEENGQILVLHRGRIGGGKEGIGKTFFADNYRGDFVTATDGDRETEFCLVGEINSPHFPVQVSDFIKEIHRVKKMADGETANGFSGLTDFSYTDEHSGRTVSERNEPVVTERTHGIIVNALARQLEKRRLHIGNDRNRDLFVHQRGKIRILFEVKTSSSTQCLYAAVGQLLLYSIPIPNAVKLVAVLPGKLSDPVAKRFSSLGINVLYYGWENDEVKFTNIDNIL